jgi:hypothetical protein
MLFCNNASSTLTNITTGKLSNLTSTPISREKWGLELGKTHKSHKKTLVIFRIAREPIRVIEKNPVIKSEPFLFSAYPKTSNSLTQEL